MQTSPFFPHLCAARRGLCRDESGTISYDEFKNVFNANIGSDAIPFDFDWYARICSRRCYGLDAEVGAAIGSSCISARRTARTSSAVRRRHCPARSRVALTGLGSARADNEFTQLMKGLQGERLRQAFKYLDKDQDGYIRPEQFKKIIMVRDFATLSHLLGHTSGLFVFRAGHCRSQVVGCRYREASDSDDAHAGRPYIILRGHRVLQCH